MFFHEIANLADNSFRSETITDNGYKSEFGGDNDSDDKIGSDSIRGSVQSDEIKSKSDNNREYLDNGSEDEYVEEVQEKENKKYDIR